MKKTIITLAALAMASVASADWTNIAGVSASNLGGNIYNIDGFTLSFYIEDGDLTSGSTILAYVNGDNTTSTDNNTQFTVALEKVGDSYTLKAARTNLADDIADINWPENNGNYATYTGLTANKTYTMELKYLSENWAQILLPDATAGGADVNGSTPDFENQIVFAQGVSTPIAKFNSTFAVPEPATATLSLLALAGLAARRRRK